MKQLKHSRNAAIAALIAAVSAAVLLFSFIHYKRPFLGLPFRESFADGKSNLWQPIGGAWDLANGTMQNHSDEWGAKLLAGSKNWRDYVVEADLEILRDYGDAGLIVRSNQEDRGVDAYNGYYVGLRNRDESLVIGRANYGWLEGRPVPMPGGVRRLTWYHLKVVVQGCEIGVSANEVGTQNRAWAMFQESGCVASGRIGLRSVATVASWRNVVVYSAGVPAELAAIRLHVKEETHPDFPKSEAAYNSSHTFPTYDPKDARFAPDKTAGSAQPPQPISSINNLQEPISHPVSVRGVVTLVSPQLYVQDVTGGVAVADVKFSALGIGDEVEITGWPEAEQSSTILRKADVRLLSGRTPPPPLSITAAQAATGAFEADFVESQGYLQRTHYESNNTIILDLDDGSQSFRAIVKGGPSEALYRKFGEQSLLRVRGICVLDPQFTQNEVPFALLLRSADDIDVLVGPPWWSAQHFIELTCGLLLLLLMILFLYVRIENWRTRGILDERERLALEMHDTLAQSFAGVGYQLQGIRNGMRNGAANWPAINEQLDRACEMVRQTHEESSLSIAMLKPGSPEFGDLTIAFERCASRIAEGGDVRVTVTRKGTIRALPLRVTDTLFHIGAEAITNAIRHAQSETVEVHMTYEANAIMLRVQDRGIGFIAGGQVRSHGLRDMNLRAASISADVHIHSAPGEGTCIEVVVPLHSRKVLAELASHGGQYIMHLAFKAGQTLGVHRR
jgi:anti-sigma regulatory factor (Ser/Thr protein kinase)